MSDIKWLTLLHLKIMYHLNKNVFAEATKAFYLVSASFDLCFMGLVSDFESQVQRCTRWATKQVYYGRKAIHMEPFMWCK